MSAAAPDRQDTAAVLALGLLPLALLWDAALGRAVFYERDVLAYWVPGIEAFVRAIAEGAWPLWDPLTTFGRPMLADPSMQVAYPPTWLNLVLSPGTYYSWFVAGHLALAGVGAFRLARAWGVGSAGAWWAGASWMLSGPLLSMATLYHHFASAAWMAWVLLALENLLRDPGRRAAGWLALAAAFMALAGSADMCLMTAAAGAARVVFALVPVAAPLPRLSRSTLGGLAAAGGLAALLCAVQWWGTLAHVAVGSRGSAGAAANMYWSAHPATLVDVVVPGFVSGLPLASDWRASVFESRGPLLRSLYLGAPALVLALVALAAGRWPMRWLAAGLAAAFLVAALGRFTPVYPAIVGLPGIRLLRFPVKYAVPAALFLSLLSAGGLDALRQEWDARARRRTTFVAIAAIAVAVLAAAGAAWAGAVAEIVSSALAPSAIDVAARIRIGLGRVAILAAVAAAIVVLRAARGPALAPIALLVFFACGDLLAAGRDAIRLGPPELLLHRPALLEALPHPETRRTFALQEGIASLNEQFTRAPAGWDPDWAWAIGHVERLAPPIPTRFGLAGSFDGDFTGLSPVALSRLNAVVQADRDGVNTLRLLRMASVTDAVGLAESFAGRPPRARRWSVYSRPVAVFTVDDPLPRAYVVAGTRTDGPAGEASVVADPGFDARHEVALDAAAGRAPSPPPAEGAGHARILDRRSDRIRVAVTATVPAVMVLTESYDPGWRAWVDGAPAPVWRANAIFRAVAVPAGDHVVEMRYRPPSAAWGAAASIVGAALTAAVMRRRAA